MLNKNAINIINKNIQRNGIEISFYRKEENLYGEIDVNTDFSLITEIKGIFHEGDSFFNTVQTTDGSRTETKKAPAVLTYYENLETLKINDVCNISGTKYRIISFQDVDVSNKFIDISMELIFVE